MAKLSQQLDAPKQLFQDRITRTQRVARLQEIARLQRVEDARIQRVQQQQEVQQIQQEQFVSKTKTETYTQSKTGDYSWGSWESLDPETQKHILAKTSPENIQTRERIRTVEVPFSFELEGENTYAEVYANLDPELKPLFQTPEIAKQSFEIAKVGQIETNVEKINTLITGRRTQIESLRAEKIRVEAREYSDSDAKAKRLDEIERRISVEERFISEYQQGLGQVQGGFSFESVVGKAEGDAIAYQDRVEGRARSVEAYKELAKSGDPFVNVYKDAFEQYQSLSTYEKARTQLPDFTKASTLTTLKQQKWLQTYEPLSQKLLATGRGDEAIIKTYKSIIGEQRFGDVQKKISVAQDKAVQDYLATPESQKIFLDLEKVDISRQGFLTRGTRRSDIDYSKPVYDFRPIKPDFEGEPFKDQSNKFSLSFSSFKKLLDKTGDIKIPIFVGAGGSIKVRDLTTPLKEDISAKKQELFLSEITRTGLKETTDIQFQKEYQTRFDQKYMKDLIKGEIDFATASEKFAKSDTAKIIQKKHGIAIEEGRAGKFTREGFAIAGLSLAELGVILIPETYGELALEGVAVAGITYVAPLIPSGVSTSATVGFGAFGTAQALSPLSSPEKKAGGVITAGISFGALGLQGIRFLRRPTIKTVKIKPPKISLKTHAIGREGKVLSVTAGGKKGTAEIIKFSKQKLSQTGIAGRRTIVSTEGRDLVRRLYREIGVTDPKVLDHGFSGPIFKGVPFAEKGTTFTLTGFRGTTSFTTLSARQKALNLLIKRGGMTNAQAQATLRYYAPKVIDITLEEGKLLIFNTQKGQFARGRFTFIQEQPKLVVDKSLGINTRFSRSVRDVFDIERKLQTNIQLKSAVSKGLSFDVLTENIRKTTMFVNKQGGSFNTLAQAGKTTTTFKQISIAQAKDPSKSFLKAVLKNKHIEITKKIPFEIQEIQSAYIRQQIIPASRRFDVGTSRTDLIKRLKTDKPIELNIDELRGISFRGDNFIQKVKIKKTPFSKTFGVDDVKDVIKDIQKTKTTTAITTNVDDIVDRITNIKQSEYYGKGVAGPDQVILSSKFSPQSFGLAQPSQQLKTAIDPIVNIKTQIKDIVLLDQGTKGALLSASLSGASLRAGVKFDTAIKTDFNIKEILKTDVAIKTTPAIKTASATQLKSIIRSSLALPQTLTPSTIPKLDIIPPQPPIPIIIQFPEILERKMRGKKKKAKQIQDLLFLPDFTSRAIGLKEVVISEKQAQAQLKKILTGLEIRRPVRVKF